MDLKRYRVNNIKEALKFIKRDLGPDALIISTRQVKEGKGALGIFGKNMLEVTAAASRVNKKNNRQKISTSKSLKSYENNKDINDDNSDINDDILNETFLRSKKNSGLNFSDYRTNFMQPFRYI